MSAIANLTSVSVASRPAETLDSEVSEGYMGPLIDLSSLKEAVHRRRRFWMATALLGTIIGAALHLVVPVKYAAVTDLYMVEPSSVNQAQAIANDVSLLETRDVADQAISDLHLHLNPVKFLASYKGTAVSDVILAIKLSASTRAEAVAYDAAVAQAFLAVRSGVYALQTQLVVNGLQGQIGSLNADIASLTGQINTLSDGQAGQQSAAQLAGLVSQRTGDASEISQLQSEVQQDQLAEKSVAQGSEVLDPAAVVKVSPAEVFATDGLSGLVAGLALGLGIVVVGEAISDRPRRRADVAAALGVPVALSVGTYRKCRWPRQWRLRRRLKTRQAPVEVLERRLHADLVATPGASLAVVAVEALEPAALSIAALGLTLADEGKRVALADMAEGHPLARLLGADDKPGPVRAVNYAGRSLSLVVAPDDPSRADHSALGDADVVIVMATITPDLGADYLRPWVNGAVVMVTAGHASAARLAATSQMLGQAGILTRSTILIGAGPEDETVGSVCPGLDLPERPAPVANSRWDAEGFGVLVGDRGRENS
ncbi:MAG TPA: Wzz/FepE/Etk N-terminal domain-containing protein [Acidimicrobiales bacterium]|nr:Wzz/FepE/Etk N-terminal domain-containing protein [Acidimicrobiales bacterium]